MKIQISFLGKARQDPKTGYRPACYRFDNQTAVKTAFFGPGLASIVQPDRFYILGTAGSMWDVLLEAQGGQDASENARLELWDKANRNEVDDALLAGFEPLVSARLGVPCFLRIIPYAQDEAGQVALLSRLAEWAGRDDELVLDVTHGLRHLPMLMLVAAHYLERVRGAKVSEIYYGALELTPQDGDTPVLKLSGLLRLLDWVQALAAYDASGDYGAFPDLLRQAGLPQEITETMKNAAFFERTMRPGQAKGQLRRVLDRLDDSILDPPAKLFVPVLRERLAWIEGEHYYLRQKNQALRLLEVRDYRGAAMSAFEAFISKQVQERDGDISNFNDRESAKSAFEEDAAGGNQALFSAYRDLRDLRNALSHGDVQSRKEVQGALSSEALLIKFLRDRIDFLFRE
jgi:CRISPR-associated Csx2 family protein